MLQFLYDTLYGFLLQGNMDVLEEDEKNMEQLLIEDNMQLLIEGKLKYM